MSKIELLPRKRKVQQSLGLWDMGLESSKPKVAVKLEPKKKKEKKKSSTVQTSLIFKTPVVSTGESAIVREYVTLGDEELSRFSFFQSEDEPKILVCLDPPEGDSRSLLAKSDSFGAIMIDQADKDFAMLASEGGVSMFDYYRVAFPVDIVVSMATAGGRFPLSHSEVGMVVDGVWWRKKVFETASSFKSFLVDRMPARIEIGPIHTVPMRGAKCEFKMDYLRHLVFDIDVDDESYLRWCECKGYKMTCMKCWALTVIGIKITVHILKVAFGFEHILEVYSGRRGAHIWVFDEKTLEYSSDARASIVSFIEKHRNPSAFSTNATDILYDEVIEPAFDSIYIDGDALTEMSISQYVLLRVPSKAARGRISDAWWGKETGRDMWNVVVQELGQGLIDVYKKQVAFGLLWVHLDTSVTVALDHLVKAPFVIHPGTGHICTPIPYHDWTPEKALTKEMVLVTPELLEPYVEHTRQILERAYAQDQK